MKKEILKAILKLIFALLIIYWLFSKGSIDFNLVRTSFDYPWRWAIVLSLGVLQAIAAAYRWRSMLEIKATKNLSLLNVTRIAWIGMFFSSVLPGAVTGDLIKVIYAKDLSPSFTKTFLLTSTFLDRVIGLIGLLILLGIFSVFHYAELSSLSPELTKLIHFNFLLFIGVIGFLIMLFLPKKNQKTILSIVDMIPVIGHRIVVAFEEVWLLGESRATIIKAILLSVLLHASNITCLWILTSPFFNHPMALSQMFTFAPIGLMAVAVPITPSGLGIGHAIFNSLFSFFGINRGASLFNIYLVATLIINLSGAIPYLLSSKKPRASDLEEATT
jgi:uncharacterized membrane protein YbhN (UPF0104 family)